MSTAREPLGDKTAYLVWLGRAREDALEAERWMNECVHQLRGMGTPWDEIARALGISKQAAWGRWGKGQ